MFAGRQFGNASGLNVVDLDGQMRDLHRLNSFSLH
jgi:hypothetical protein